MKQRCLGALYDAAMMAPVAVDPEDARLAAATGPPKWGACRRARRRPYNTVMDIINARAPLPPAGSTIEHSRGSSPGQITQYSSTPGQDEATSEEGLEVFYPCVRGRSDARARPPRPP